jgi:acetyltransferase-like isoleucine patch superfamily enzyme
VGDYAFADLKNLATLELGKLTSIGDYAFYRTAIKTAPDLSGVSVIGDYAFAYSSLESVAIPDGVTVGQSAFRECKSLRSVKIGNNAVIGDNAFRLDTDTNFTTASYKVEDKALYYYILTSPMTELTIGENATIGHSAFFGASKLESVTLGKGAVIGDFAFYNNDSLKNMDLSGVISVGDSAFSCDMLAMFTNSAMTVQAYDENGNYIYRFYAADLESVDLESATSIGDNAFAQCRLLKSVKLGAGVTHIPEQAFFYCTNLKHVYNYAPEPQLVSAIFKYPGITVHVPAASVERYRNAQHWKQMHIVGDL